MRCRFQRRYEQYLRSQAAADAARDESEEKVPDVVFEGGFRIPGELYNKLYDYQKTGNTPSLTAVAVHMGCQQSL